MMRLLTSMGSPVLTEMSRLVKLLVTEVTRETAISIMKSEMRAKISPLGKCLGTHMAFEWFDTCVGKEMSL